MKFIEDIISNPENNFWGFAPEDYAGRHKYKNLEFCIYAYLRESEDEHGPENSIYYIGEGLITRPEDTHRVRIPSRKYIKILKRGIDKKEAWAGEELLINYFGRTWNNTGILLNKKKGGDYHSTNDYAAAVVISTGEKISVHCDDSRWGSEIVGPSYRKATAKDTITGILLPSQVSLDDPRWKSGEIVGHRKGMRNAWDPITGEKYYVAVDDPIIKEKGLVHVNTGKKQGLDENGICLWYDADNSGFTDGTLRDPRTGMYTARDSITGEKIRVEKNSILFKEGLLVGHRKGNLTIKHPITGERKKVLVDSDEYIRDYVNGEWIDSKTGYKQRKIVCDHCNKEYPSGTYTRYHGDKCKANPHSSSFDPDWKPK